VSWAFSLKEINQFLMSSQIGQFLSLGLKNRYFLFSFDLPLMGFKLGDDLLEVPPLLPCDNAYQVWWQLVLIWPQIRRTKGGGDFSELSVLADSWFTDSPPVNHGQSGTQGQNCVLLGVFWTLNCGQSVPSGRQSETKFQTEYRTCSVEFGSWFLTGGQSDNLVRTVRQLPVLCCSVRFLPVRSLFRVPSFALDFYHSIDSI
jgi:hypothetical protein